jgi:hypothetical protein
MSMKLFALFAALSLLTGCITESIAARSPDSPASPVRNFSSAPKSGPKYPPIHPWEDDCIHVQFPQCGGGG